MKITFLGTGAADWDIEKRVEGEFFRRLSSALIDDDLLIDPGPHIFDFCKKNNCEELLDEVGDIIVTHSHVDHFNIETVRKLCERKSRRILCNQRTADMLVGISDNVTVVDFGQEYKAGEYTIIPLNANHSVNACGEKGLMYIVEGKNKRIFYGCDSAWIPYESWAVMKTKKFDCVVFEVTLGDVIGDSRIFEHNNIRMTELMLETVRNRNLLNESSIVCATHFSRFAHEEHDKLSARLASFGMIAAYDGLSMEF
ncbi:MAG: MBL fold metallo-hydrolase [Ruminococcaceae bacterium]|nr:MBL fold metallo-hydrolase [Oscillospiraceae bacterium]